MIQCCQSKIHLRENKHVMWSGFSVKTQLIVLMALIIVLVEGATLFLVLNIQNRQNYDFALNEARAITQSLNNDLLKYLLTPTADTLSDITFRLSAFTKIDGVVVYDEAKKAVFTYGKTDHLLAQSNHLFSRNTITLEHNLLIKNSLSADGYTFGYVFLDLNLTSFVQQQNQITYSILAIFPFALLFGFLVSLMVSRSFTRPFLQLLEAMRTSSPAEDKIVRVDTSSNNEIKELFDGFNTAMEQIAATTKKLHNQATHDQLTGIYNRFFIENELQNALKEEASSYHCLLHINLDQFKLINDSAGTEAGDKLLQMLTTHYQAILTSEALFSRIDGDSFMVLLKNCSRDKGEAVLRESLERLHDFRFSYSGDTYSVSASISLVVFAPFQYTLKELIKASTNALKIAKQKGRNKSHIYDPSDATIRRISLEVETAKLIKEALDGGPARFELFAQDIVPLQYSSDQVGYEILIRMWDRDGKFIPPNDFLPTAERYQLMSDIDSFVLWNYLETVISNKAHIDKLHSVHINLAGSSLNNPDFQAKVKEAVEYFDFPWEKLELEVTESSAIGNFNRANEFIGWLKNKGIGLALDDFGTGMASFEYLKCMPFDIVKIDGSFVKEMHNDPADKAVIKYIHEIATLKGQKTVAEYVETQQDVDTLTQIGITYGQGYHLGKPRSLSSWLE